MKYFFINVLVIFSFEVMSQNWETVGTGLNQEVYDIITFENKLYAGGKMGVAYFNDSTWTSLPIIYDIANPLSLEVYNNSLFASGDFPYFGSISKILKFDGANWEQVGEDFDETSWSSTKAMTTFNNRLVAGGRFSTIGNDSINNIAVWDGSTWAGLGFGLNNMVTDVYEHNNKLFAIGQFTASGSDTAIKTIAYWDETKWNSLDSNQTISSASKMITYENSLIIGNVWDTLDGIAMNGIAKWDGDSFATMGNKLIRSVTNFWEFNDELYLSGSTYNLNPNSYDNVILKWNGYFWEQIGNTLDDMITVISQYNGELYCGGFFNETSNYLAKLSFAVGVKDELNSKFKLYPNPSSQYFIIESEITNSKLKIYDLLGNLVLNKSIGIGVTKIDVSKLSKGLYTLTIENQNKKSYSELIVH